MAINVSLFLLLLLVIIALMLVANKLKIAYPILLVIGGLALSFIPNLPKVHINPELIFIVFLPPLLYEETWAISQKELWKWRRIIVSLAFPAVFITAAAVAWVANMVFPGFALPLGFLLGGIVSPTDTVSTNAIAKFVKIPKRIEVILGNESLLNDASGLIVFRMAAIAVTTGQFLLGEASLNFVWMVLGGIAIGLAVAFLMYKFHKYLPTDRNMDIILTLITPYVIYILADFAQTSGVLAVVAGGLFLSRKREEIFTAGTRNNAVAVWDVYVFVLNGLAFALIGLDLPQILEGIQAKEGIDLWTAITYGLIVTGVLIVVRFGCILGAAVITQIMKHFITVADDRLPGKAGPLVMGWAGMRGVVSLATALSIPLTLADKVTPFPHRDLILFITFVMILTTLVVQGLTFPWLIKAVPFPDYGDHIEEAEAEDLIRKEMARAAVAYMEANFPDEIERSFLLTTNKQIWEHQMSRPLCTLTEHARGHYIEVLHHQREVLTKLNEDPSIDEEVINAFRYRLNLEEEKWVDNE